MTRLLAGLRRAYLRRLIRSAEADAARHEWHAQREPQLADLARRRIQQLHQQLALLTTSKGSK